LSDIILIYPALEQGKNPHGSVLPLCYAWISSLLEKNDISVRIVDYQIEDVDIEELIREENPLCVGVSGTTQSRFSSFQIINRIKAVDRDILTLYGGPHATPAAEDTLSHLPTLDVVVRNEGELTTLEIMTALKRDRNIDTSKILGISFRENGQIVHNPGRPFLKDLDELPFPGWHLFKMDRYRIKLEKLDLPAHVILTSRGCPFQCSFCSARLLWGGHYATRTAGNIADELEYLAERYGIKGYKIFDSTFTVSRAHVLAVCREIKKRGLEVLPWECEIRADTVDKDLLRTMKEAGCYYVDVGMESASPRVLKTIHKNITIRQIENVIDWADELGLLVKLFLTWGHPTETYQEAMLTYRFYKKHKAAVRHLATHIGIMIYPGTGVEKFAIENACLPPDFSWSAPYYEASNINLGCDPRVPLLFQPQLQFKHLAKIHFKIHWKPLFTLSNVLKKLREVILYQDLRKRHFNTLIDLLNQRLGLRIGKFNYFR
jgi:anaerobic magnesium-protoporphyrin IX monomethyl ester cyclase